MAFTRREAQIRDEILTALAGVPEKKLVAPHVIRQLKQLCNFPADTTSWEVEAVLRRMAKVHQITFNSSRLIIREIALTDTTKEA